MPDDGTIVSNPVESKTTGALGKSGFEIAADNGTQPNVVLVNQNAINRFRVGTHNRAPRVMRSKHSKSCIAQIVTESRTGCGAIADE